MTSRELGTRLCHLALGSAYFRTEQFPDAEREYKAAIAVEPKSGEAFNNLAALYLQTESLQGGRRGGEVGGEGRLQGASATEAGHQGQVGQIERHPTVELPGEAG